MRSELNQWYRRAPAALFCESGIENVHLGEHKFLLGVVETGRRLDGASLDQVVAQLGKPKKKDEIQV